MGFMIYSILLLLSFVFMGLEIAAVRIITPYYGNSVYTWGSIISVFLIGSSIGYWLGGKSADVSRHGIWLKRYFVLCTASVALIPHAAIFILPYLQSFSEGLGSFIGASLLFIIPNLLLSAIIPSMIKIGLSRELSGTRIGSYHMISSLGSILGTMLTTFVLLPNFHINEVFALFTAMLIVCFICYLYQEPKAHWRSTLWLMLFCLIPFLSTQTLWFPQSTLIAHISSPYHEIYVTEKGSYNELDGSFRFLQFGKGGYQGGINLDQPDQDLFSYTRNMTNIIDVYHPNSSQVFMIGHGIGTLTKSMGSRGKIMDVAEIDEGVLDASRRYFGYKGNEVRIGDGRVLLGKREDQSIDVILLDAYNGGSIPFHLTTQEFFRLTDKKLKKDGILVINVIGKAQNDPFIEAIHATIASVYTHVKWYATSSTYKDKQNLFVAASPRELKDELLMESTLIQVDAGDLILDGETKFIHLN